MATALALLGYQQQGSIPTRLYEISESVRFKTIILT